jgi:large subunit ribosomal protein L9
VSPRDIADIIGAGGFSISRTQVPLDKAIKTIGLFPVYVVLHPEVRVHVTVNVARTEDEAERQARGEDVLTETVPEEETAEPAELFEEGAGPAEAEDEAAK